MGIREWAEENGYEDDGPEAEVCDICGEEMTFVDDSFDHEFGTEVCHSWVCENEDCTDE
jgi:hypothetical protein